MAEVVGPERVLPSVSVTGKRCSITDDSEPRIVKRVKTEHINAAVTNEDVQLPVTAGVVNGSSEHPREVSTHGDLALDMNTGIGAATGVPAEVITRNDVSWDPAIGIAEPYDAQSVPGPTPDVDFSSAPSDPVELALWVAQQISHFQQPGDESNVELEHGSGSQSPALSPDPSQDNDDPALIIERARQRVENRERKKRWRESNAERSEFTFEWMSYHEVSDNASSQTKIMICDVESTSVQNSYGARSILLRSMPGLKQNSASGGRNESTRKEVALSRKDLRI